MSNVCVIEARMTSKRLPGKVLLDINGFNSIEHIVRRLSKVEIIDKFCLAITNNREDDILVEIAKRLGIEYYRGSESDVLSRVLESAQHLDAENIIEITGDCPLVDPSLVEQFFQMFQYNNFDYVSNNIYSTYADGFDVQIFKTSTLATSNNLVTTNSEKEHVTMHIKQHKEMFRLLNVIAPLKYRRPDLAVTLDTFEDLHVITRVFEEFAENYFVGFEEITQFLAENPSISAINSKVKRVGYGSS